MITTALGAGDISIITRTETARSLRNPGSAQASTIEPLFDCAPEVHTDSPEFH